jgi:peptidoglycan/LPS O-acetylase OafA/YrhL
MMGTYRFFLSNVVVFCHLWVGSPPWSELGYAAVFSFFVMSGYLMTLAVNRTYGFSVDGLSRYALNRALRVYPQYWLVMLFAIFVVMAFPQESYLLNAKLTMPNKVSSWLANIFIFGLLDGPIRVLVPPAWSLDIELVFYVLMGLGLSRSKPLIVVWFLASLGYTAWMLMNGIDFEQRYASYAAASLPFSIGAMTYVYRDACKRFLYIPLPIAVVLLAVMVVLVRNRVFGHPHDAGFYVLFATSILVLISINSMNSKSLSEQWRKKDRLLGELAYPIFLCHWPVAAVVVHFGFAGERPDDSSLWLASVVFVHLLGLLVYYLGDYNVHKLRDKVRGKRLDIL